MRVLLAGLPARAARDLMAACAAAGAVALDCPLDEVTLMIGAEAIDAVVMNPRASGGVGAQVATRIRAERLDVSLLLLAERVAEAEEIAWLTLADDVVEAGRTPALVVAKLRAIERRRLGHAADRIVAGPVTVDRDRRQVMVDGRDLALPRVHYEILDLLVLRRGRFVRAEGIIEALWPDRPPPTPRTVYVYVSRLRYRLADAGVPLNLIAASRGRGYLVRREPSEPSRPVLPHSVGAAA